MPHNTTCIQCGRVGFVRMERVIKGLELQLSFYCGACDHTWQVRQEDPRMDDRRGTVRRKIDRRKPSRTDPEDV